MGVVSTNKTLTIAMSVKDRKKSVAWYQDMLGFEPGMEIDEAGWSEMATNIDGVTLGFGEQAEPNPGNAIPVFGVDDLDAARAGLESHKVRFDGPTEEMPGMVKLATFYDPDGNALMLAQDLTGQG